MLTSHDHYTFVTPELASELTGLPSPRRGRNSCCEHVQLSARYSPSAEQRWDLSVRDIITTVCLKAVSIC